MTCSFKDHAVLINGKETQILSGAIHYFRTMPEQWEDRLRKLKACGFNTVETYLAWHLHEETEGDFDFSGRLDFVRFIRTAQRLGLHVIVRPGPYICSECDLGGMPGWLLGKAGLRLRSNEPVFMHYAGRYLRRVLPLLKPLQCTQGGPIIAMQIENEYGGYGRDKEYLKALREVIRGEGINIPLFTSDGASSHELLNGSLPDVAAAVNFRDDPKKNIAVLAQTDTGYRNPFFAAELWVGKAWFWNMPPEHHAADPVADDIRTILRNKWHVNCYMFHGGTNFGFTSGANYVDGYYPLLTSYEVDALLDESGRITPKYEAVRKVMNSFGRGSTESMTDPVISVPSPFMLTEAVALGDCLNALSLPVICSTPETMEHFGQSFGFIHYSRRMKKRESGTWTLCGMKDRAVVLLDRKLHSVVMRGEKEPVISLKIPEDGTLLEILVENMGRVNVGYEMENERKGLVAVSNGSLRLMDWEVRCLPMKDLSKLKFSAGTPPAGPAFHRGRFRTERSSDLFLRFPKGTRGYVWVNGFNVGRYWTVGPQETLYLPAPLIKAGENEVIVFETDGLSSSELAFAPGRIIASLMDEETCRRMRKESMDGSRRAEVFRLASSEVTLDGTGSEAFWKDIPAIEVGTHCASGISSPVKATVKAAVSGRFLYLLAEMREPKMDRLRDVVTLRNGPVWNENCIEFFFDPENRRKDFRQLLVNSLGTVAEFRQEGGLEKPWTSQARAAVTRSADSWTAEVEIPLSAFGKVPKPGDIWGFNACRDRVVGGPRERLSWNPTFGEFGHPDRFGKLIFQ